jgi:hypothetical protein
VHHVSKIVHCTHCHHGVPDVQHSIAKVASKLPALGDLEAKLGVMKNLHPELESINKELREITSNVDMKAAKEGGKLIKKVLEVPTKWMHKSVEHDLGHGHGVSHSTSHSHVHSHSHSHSSSESESHVMGEVVGEAVGATEVHEEPCSGSSSHVVEEEHWGPWEQVHEAVPVKDDKQLAKEAASAVKSISKEAEELAKSDPKAAKEMVEAAGAAAIRASKK